MTGLMAAGECSHKHPPRFGLARQRTPPNRVKQQINTRRWTERLSRVRPGAVEERRYQIGS